MAPLVLALAACGGKASGSAPGGSSGGSGNGAGGTSHAGASQGGATACAKYDDEGPTFVSVAIINKTSAPIYLGQPTVTCDVSPLFEVADARGGQLPNISRCRSSCADLRQEGAAGCIDICLFPLSVALQPGEARATTWDGLFSVPAELPRQCVAFDTDQKTVVCDQAQRIQPGTFTFSARAGTRLDCSQTQGADAICPPCTGEGNGGCATPGSLISGDTFTATATVTLDDSYGVYPTANGSSNPSPGAGAGPNGNPELASVELVFTD